MRARLNWLVVDCADPERVAAFWAALLDAEVERRRGPYVFVSATDNSGVRLLFQRVPEPKAGKNRVHPDLTVDDLAAAVARIEELGGRRVPGYETGGFLVMADPEGNEFCVLPESGLTMDEHGVAHYDKP